MAPVVFLFVLVWSFNVNSSPVQVKPFIQDICIVKNEFNYKKYHLYGNFHNRTNIRIAKTNPSVTNNCSLTTAAIHPYLMIENATFASLLVNLSADQLYTRVCLSEGDDGVWEDQNVTLSEYIKPCSQSRHRRFQDFHPAITVGVDDNVTVHGFRMEGSSANFDDEGVVTLLAQSKIRMRLFGQNITPNTVVAFTAVNGTRGSHCEFMSSEVFTVDASTRTAHSVIVEIKVPEKPKTSEFYYLCVKNAFPNWTGRALPWYHQGNDPWLTFQVAEKLLPLWAMVIFIIILLMLSALFSGLTLGLMSLDKTDLKILQNTGTEAERRYAKAIIPVRSHGSLLLCSLLLGNVLVNSVVTILMDELTSGLIAVIFSTLTIVIFGEIMPQAVCSRHGLAVGANTIILTRIVICITFIVAYPISKILDWMLGEEIGNVYNRERLNELVKTGTNIEKDEVNIISGALELSKKTVAQIMTKIEDVYMLSYDAILDFETVSDIMNSGFSRIPVYDKTRTNIITLLFIKDLAFVDPDDNTPLKTLCEFYQNSCYFVFEDMTLDVLFKKFKEGTFGHMAFVQRVNSEGEGDPFYETIGLVTLEDVIEELIQSEIVDETDVWIDNRTKKKREKLKGIKDFTAFAGRRENQKIHISAHLTLAAFQYLSTSVDPFKPPIISEAILQRLLKQDVYRHIKVKNKDKELIYKQGKPADYFVLILEGRVEVLVGKENMRFESGPFTYFAVQALQQSIGVGAESPTSGMPSSATGSLQSVNVESIRHTFVPDYTVKATTEVFYILVKRTVYLAAKKATQLAAQTSRPCGPDMFEAEVVKLLHSMDEDDQQSQDGGGAGGGEATTGGSDYESRRGSHYEQESPLLGSSVGARTPPLAAAPNGALPFSSPTPAPTSTVKSPNQYMSLNSESDGECTGLLQQQQQHVC